MSLINEEIVNACGLAELEKRRGCAKAQLKCIKNIELPMYGECHFYPESDWRDTSLYWAGVQEHWSSFDLSKQPVFQILAHVVLQGRAQESDT